MLTRALQHLRSNLVAYLALFVALGGTSYAALNLPVNSVGARQIRNHSIDAVKLNPSSIAASIRAWANVQWQGGKLVAIASNSPVRVLTDNNGEDIAWLHQRFSDRCTVSATPQVNADGGGSGTVTAQFTPRSRSVFLNGFGTTRQAQAAFVMIVCP